jgi:hypothetical protein
MTQREIDIINFELDEIWEQLNCIHTEHFGELTYAGLLAAYDRGEYDQCQCALCQVMSQIVIFQVGLIGGLEKERRDHER